MISVHGHRKEGINKISDWFLKNFHKRYADKSHLITTAKIYVEIEVSNIMVISEEEVKLLGICIGNRLNSDYHISKLCKKVGGKMHALTWVFKYMHIS